MPFLFPESYISLPKLQAHTCTTTCTFMYFSQNSYMPSFFRSGRRNTLLTPHQVVLVFTNRTPNLVCLIFPSRIFIFGLSYPSLFIYPLKMTWKSLNRRRTCSYSTSSREFEECLNKRGTILEGNTARMKTENPYRKMGSVYFYLINVNVLRRLSESNVELVKLHTGHIFIGYKLKIYSLPFLHSSGKPILLVV